MSSTTFGALFQKAKDDGAFDDVIPDGDFHVEIKRANAKTTQKGDDSIGVQFKVVGPDDDPAKGKTTWLNLNFSEKAAPISFRQLREWGVSEDFLNASERVDDVAEVLPGIVLDVQVGHRNWGANDENVNNTFKVYEVLVPPAAGAAAPKASTRPSEAVADDSGY